MIWNISTRLRPTNSNDFEKWPARVKKFGPPCFRETSQHFGGTCKPATVSKGCRSTKSLESPALSGPGNGQKLPKLGLHSKIKCFGFKTVLQ